MPLRYLPLFLIPGLFVWLTSGSLPAVVASHFAGDGSANGFMVRSTYISFMTAFVVLLPLFVALSGRLAGMVPIGLVNLPNREYWLAPERKSATLATLSRMLAWFAALLAVFLCFAHLMVVRANAVHPARLENTPFLIAMGVFGVVVVIWAVVLFRRFNRVPQH